MVSVTKCPNCLRESEQWMREEDVFFVGKLWAILETTITFIFLDNTRVRTARLFTLVVTHCCCTCVRNILVSLSRYLIDILINCYSVENFLFFLNTIYRFFLYTHTFIVDKLHRNIIKPLYYYYDLLLEYITNTFAINIKFKQ